MNIGDQVRQGAASGHVVGRWDWPGSLPQAGSSEVILDVHDLTIDFNSIDGRLRPLEKVSISVSNGEIVGVVGESGSGKSTLSLALLGLLDSPPAVYAGGSISFQGTDLLKGSMAAFSKVRGFKLGMVLQESIEALNPVYTIGFQMREALEVLAESTGRPIKREEIESECLRLLAELCIDNPELVLTKYPHELSGGMRKRVAIAMSVLERPQLLILDEPTTGLDAYVQNRILSLLKRMSEEYGLAMLIVTHDLVLASRICDRVYVMYAGRILESGLASQVLREPLHPYTRVLVSSVPEGFSDSPDLPVQTGEPADIRKLPRGCKFQERCPLVRERCRMEEPQLFLLPEGRTSRCWLMESGIRTYP